VEGSGSHIPGVAPNCARLDVDDLISVLTWNMVRNTNMPAIVAGAHHESKWQRLCHRGEVNGGWWWAA